MRWLLLLCFVSSGCDGTISVQFYTSPQAFSVSVDEVAPPAELRDASGTIAAVPCGPEGICPPSDVVTLTCNASTICDPAAKTIQAPVGGVIDIAAILAETREIGVTRVESYSFDELRYEVTLNTLTFPVGPVDIYWGPETATAIDAAMGVARFGTLPTVEPGTTPRGMLTIDPAGAGALGDHLVAGGTRIRFFAQTTVDLDPGDPFPEGSVEGSVNVLMTAVGRVFE
jgi:hypothetical protein